MIGTEVHSDYHVTCDYLLYNNILDLLCSERGGGGGEGESQHAL